MSDIQQEAATDEVVERADRHIRQMSPHIREREQSQILIRCIARIRADTILIAKYKAADQTKELSTLRERCGKMEEFIREVSNDAYDRASLGLRIKASGLLAALDQRKEQT